MSYVADPISETVNFNVHVQYTQKDGKWIGVTMETGIIAVGYSQKEASEAVIRWNENAIKEATKNGRDALRKYLEARDVPYQVTEATL